MVFPDCTHLLYFCIRTTKAQIRLHKLIPLKKYSCLIKFVQMLHLYMPNTWYPDYYDPTCIDTSIWLFLFVRIDFNLFVLNKAFVIVSIFEMWVWLVPVDDKTRLNSLILKQSKWVWSGNTTIWPTRFHAAGPLLLILLTFPLNIQSFPFLQTNPRHCGEEPQNTNSHNTPGRQLKKSNLLKMLTKL